jgi:nicotinate-nucleotide pyrophosphorylase (carboxylating)
MHDLNGLPLPELYRHFAGSGLVRRLCELARDEDLGAGRAARDITSLVSVPESARALGMIVARQAGTVAGLAALPELIDAFGFRVDLSLAAADGQAAQAGATLATLRGSRREVLTLERTALNLVGRLSGVASRTAEFVAALHRAGTARARIFDIRKTTPGLRVLEKYAVRCGGGFCHRIGLFDAVLIKDNHLAGVAIDDLVRVVTDAACKARAQVPAPTFVEVEVESLEQLRRVLSVEPGLVDIVLLDNMGLDAMRRAVDLRDAEHSRIELEASGGVRLETVAPIARTGVDRISAGALTQGAVCMDVAMDLEAS